MFHKCHIIFPASILILNTGAAWCQSTPPLAASRDFSKIERLVVGQSTPAIKVSVATELSDLLTRAQNEKVYDDEAIYALFKLHLPPSQGVPIFRSFIQRWLKAIPQDRHMDTGPATAALNATVELGKYGLKAAEAVPDLLQLAQGQQPWSLLRYQAHLTLLKVAPLDPRVTPLLIAGLDGPSSDAVRDEMRALGSQGAIAISAIPALLSIINDEYQEDKACFAYDALGKIVTQHYHFTLAEASTRLGTIESQSLAEGAAAFETLRSTKDQSGSTIQLMTELLKKQKQPYIRYAAVMTLDQMGVAAKPSVLTELMRQASNSRNENYGPVNEAALEAISRSITPATREVLPLLISTLRAPSFETRYIAAAALCRLGPNASPALPTLMSSMKEEMKSGQYIGVGSYANVVMMLGPKAVAAIPTICNMLRPNSPYLRKEFGLSSFRPYALNMLSAIGLPEGSAPRQMILAQVLTGLRSTEVETVSAAARLASSFKGDAADTVPLLAAVLKSGERDSGLVAPSGEAHVATKRLFWNWNNPQTEGSFAQVIRTLGIMGSKSIYAIPILQRYHEMADGAPLAGLRSVSKVALTRIAVDQNRSLIKQTEGTKPAATTIKLLTLDQAILNHLVPDVKAVDNAGQPLLLRHRKGKPLVLFFADTTCPCVLPYVTRLRTFTRKYRSQGVEMAFVFPTKQETPSQIKAFALKNRLPGKIIRDETLQILKNLNAQRTTQSILIDGNGILRYSGRFDDNIFKPSLVKEKSLERAMQTVLGKGVISRIGVLPESCELAYFE